MLLLLGAAGIALGEKVGWWFVISLGILIETLCMATTLMLGTLSGVAMFFYIPPILVFIALLLLIYDRNNYFAAIEKEKNKLN